MKLAYLILAHNDVEQLNNLISCLSPEDDIYIHVDQKASSTYISRIKSINNNVQVINKRFNIYWAGFNMVEATLALIHAMLSAHVKYRKIILLSGQDFPVRTNAYIHDFFDNDTNFIRGFNISEYTTIDYRKQIVDYHYNDSNFLDSNSFLYKISRRFLNRVAQFKLFPNNNDYANMFGKRVSIFEGSQWWALNQDFLAYAVKFCDSEEGIKFKRAFKHFLAPDEKFFQTIFFNSTFYKSNSFNGPEEFPWHIFNKYRGTLIEGAAPTAYMHNVHIIHPSLRKVFTNLDDKYLKEQLKNKNNLFVRKITSDKSSVLLNIIRKNICEK